MKLIENELTKAKEQNIIGTNNNIKQESIIKRLKKQLYMVTWVGKILFKFFFLY